MSERLHRAVDVLIVEQAAQMHQRDLFSKVWPQMALALLVLVGSIIGIAYQNHPTVNAPMYARR